MPNRCAALVCVVALTCSLEGGCVSTGGDCPGLLSPVCGCDGNSYTNEQCARAAGTNVAHDGECEP